MSLSSPPPADEAPPSQPQQAKKPRANKGRAHEIDTREAAWTAWKRGCAQDPDMNHEDPMELHSVEGISVLEQVGAGLFLPKKHMLWNLRNWIEKAQAGGNLAKNRTGAGGATEKRKHKPVTLGKQKRIVKRIQMKRWRSYPQMTILVILLSYLPGARASGCKKGSLPNIAHASWSAPKEGGSTYQQGETATLTCTSGFKKQPPGANAKCHDEGTFSADKFIGAGLKAACGMAHTVALYSSMDLFNL